METNTSLDTILKDRFDALPEEIRQAFLDPKFDEHFDKIVHGYNLDAIQSAMLMDEIVLVLFLFEPITNLKKNITKRLNVTEDVADDIVFDLEYSVFLLVFDTLNEIARDPKFVGIRDTNTNNALGQVPKVDGEIREKLELRPEGMSSSEGGDGGAPKPLTREEVLSALTPKRTMQGDIRTIQSQEGK